MPEENVMILRISDVKADIVNGKPGFTGCVKEEGQIINIDPFVLMEKDTLRMNSTNGKFSIVLEVKEIVVLE